MKLFVRRDFAKHLVALMGAAGSAAPRSARASGDRPERLQLSHQILKLQKSLQKLLEESEQAEIEEEVRINALGCLREAGNSLQEAQGYLTQGRNEQ